MVMLLFAIHTYLATHFMAYGKAVHHHNQYADNQGSSEYYNPVNSQQFFDDTSGQGIYRGDASSPPPTVPNKMFTDPLASMALQYGSNFANSGQEYVNSNVRIIQYVILCVILLAFYKSS